MMRRRRKERGGSGLNVWRSYSDMMAGVLLLFVLLMCVTLFQAQKSYEENLALQEEYTREILEQQGIVITQQDEIASKDELLAAQKTQLDELAAKLETQRVQLELQEVTLSAQKTSLDEQSLTISTQQQQIDEKTTQLAQQQAQIDKIIGVKADVIEALKVEFANNNINVEIDDKGSLLLDSSVLFEYDKTELIDAGQEVLSKVLPVYCNVLLQDEYYPYVAEIIIAGYTDSTGDYTYNLELSQKRSLTVAEYLLNLSQNLLSDDAQAKLREKLSVNGNSSSDPILDENGNEDADASRRVEVKFRLRDEEMLEELQGILDTELFQ